MLLKISEKHVTSCWRDWDTLCSLLCFGDCCSAAAVVTVVRKDNCVLVSSERRELSLKAGSEACSACHSTSIEIKMHSKIVGVGTSVRKG